VTDATALKALENEAHVWIAYPDAVSPEHLAKNYLHLLDHEERDRYQRFYFDPDRHTYLAAHALLRTALSRYVSCQPEQWRFVRGEHGKPELEPTLGIPPLRFNLSHTKGMVACVIALERDCGVDVECVRPMKDMKGIAEAVFSDSENAYLNSQSEADWPRTFFTFWTLKEAYIKAIGLGLTAPLRKITFNFHNSKVSVASDDEKLLTSMYQFHHYQPDSTHHLAVAVTSSKATCKFIFHEHELSSKR
jgi:4'-phosphopantetheinyl transferase